MNIGNGPNLFNLGAPGVGPVGAPPAGAPAQAAPAANSVAPKGALKADVFTPAAGKADPTAGVDVAGIVANVGKLSLADARAQLHGSTNDAFGAASIWHQAWNG
ncbi:MAG: hypothetical protein AB7P76_04350 [Candidatus Melainabacteria bacterium]